MTMYSITDFYGSICDDNDALLQPTLRHIAANEVVYVEVDGSMIFTCDDAWKEVKVGRAFKASDCIKPNTDNGCIKHSQTYLI